MRYVNSRFTYFTYLRTLLTKISIAVASWKCLPCPQNLKQNCHYYYHL